MGEGPEDVRRSNEERERAESYRTHHETLSRSLVEQGLASSRAAIVNGHAMSDAERASAKEASRRGGLLSRALRKVQALAEWHAVSRRSSKSRTMPREYVLTAEEQALVDEYRARMKKDA